MNWANIANVQRVKKPEKSIIFNGFPHGLNTSTSPLRIRPTEVSALINWVIKPGGKLVNRDAITEYTTTAAASNASVDTIEKVIIGGTQRVLTVDANYKLDYLDTDPKPVNIGTTKGATQIVGYNDVAVILDGSYIKYCDGITEIKIAYDAGTGTNGYQFDYTGEDNDAQIGLGNGTNVGVAQKFTTQTWDSGFTIPIVKFGVYLSKTGTPNASAINATLRLGSDASTLEQIELVADATEVSGTATLYEGSFTGVTNEFSQNTSYFICVEHDGGDGSNHINVHCVTVSSGGTSYNNDGTLTTVGDWNVQTTKNCLMYVQPGRPPKGAFGVIRGNRLFVAGDPDNPGYVWYCNLTHLDWSTANGGGHEGAVDDSANNFEVGGLATLFGDLYIYGKENQPYLSKITGASPSSFAQSLIFQKPWSTHKTLISAVNDIWAGSGDGIFALSGVQEYGDLRTFTESDPIEDRLNDYWSTSTALAAYYPTEGQYWLVLPTHHRVLIAHTKIPSISPDGLGYRYPWCEYEIYRRELTNTTDYEWKASGSKAHEYYVEQSQGRGDIGFGAQPDFISMDGTPLTEGTVGSLADHEWDYGDNDSLGYSTVYVRDNTGTPQSSGVIIREIMVPTSMAADGNRWLIGGSNGFIYELNSSQHKDMTDIQILPKCLTAYIELPISYANANAVQLLASCVGSATIDIRYYTDGREIQYTTSFTVSDGLTIDEAVMDVASGYFSSDKQNRLFYPVNLNFMSVMLSFSNVALSGNYLYLDGAILKYRALNF